ncbi:hypothetical protein V1478_014346 [Vespula squamosa]|uniref:Uncharacterized protein n=1 Tax=Vespula squamosa TaxID=30214 RepID=A0ABD2A7W6_VESSQ
MSNFGEHRTSKQPRAIRTVKQAKQGRDIGYALIQGVQLLSGDNERRRGGVLDGGGGGGGWLEEGRCLLTRA